MKQLKANPHHSKASKNGPMAKPKAHRAAIGITAGMRELQEMMSTGKSYHEMQFTVRTVRCSIAQ